MTYSSTNAVCYDINNGTIDIYLSEATDRCEYALLDASNKVISKGCLFGRIKKTCLYLGELAPGQYFMELNESRTEFLVDKR